MPTNFWSPPVGKSIRECLAEADPGLAIEVPWRTYLPDESDNSGEPNVLRRIRYRLERETVPFCKVMVPGIIARHPNAVIAPGAHRIKVGKRRQNTQPPPEGMFLAHFPVRSMEQLKGKIYAGWLSDLCRAFRRSGEAYHWKLMYDGFLDEGDEAKDLHALAVSYLGGPLERGEDPRRVLDPVDPALTDFDIRQPKAFYKTPFFTFARTAETIARDYGELATRLQRLENSPRRAFKLLLRSINRRWLGRP